MTEEPKMAAGPVTVDQMVRDPELIRRRLQEMARQQFVLQELWPAAPSPSPSPSRWWRWKCRARQARAGMRERVALWLAPWLANGEDDL